eukprot:4657813-Pyramimonas_sp.AAC.1
MAAARCLRACVLGTAPFAFRTAFAAPLMRASYPPECTTLAGPKRMQHGQHASRMLVLVSP